MYVANAHEKSGRQDFARQTKIFRVKTKIFNTIAEIFVLG